MKLLFADYVGVDIGTTLLDCVAILAVCVATLGDCTQLSIVMTNDCVKHNLPQVDLYPLLASNLEPWVFTIIVVENCNDQKKEKKKK